MAVLDVAHPDINEFILSKTRAGTLQNFNISVAVGDDFMRAVLDDGEYELINPRTKTPVRRRSARDVFDTIAAAAWQCGDPGLVFLDEINRANPLLKVGRIEATNPCGEQPLLPWEPCNLGSINVAHFVSGEDFDYDALGETVDVAVHFLDNVVDASRFPLPEVSQAAQRSRKIGLGVMGFADALYLLNVPYDSERGLSVAEKLMEFISHRAHEASVKLAEHRGSFPLFEKSNWAETGMNAFRNATVTTVAPTGTIGLIAGVSSGIEPVFALRHWRRMAEGATLLETHPLFAKRMRQLGINADALFNTCASSGSIKDCAELPQKIRDVFVVARDIDPQWHVRMQAAFQKYTDNGVSKTVNLSRDATVGAVRKVYLLAHELHCKGITVYREGSKEEDLLHAGLPAAAGTEGLPSMGEDVEDLSGRCRCP